jgi:predicted TIM-barrel fold metal-dependent hydrolase
MAVTAKTTPARSTRIARVDADVHPAFPQGWKTDLAPYLPDEWNHRFAPTRIGQGASSKLVPSAYEMPRNPFYQLAGGGNRSDLQVRGTPCSDPRFSAEDLLDRYAIDRGILLPQDALNLGTLPTPAVARVLARATNDWITTEWLPADNRWRGVITVAPQDPAWSAGEIDRLASTRGIVGILFPIPHHVMGHDSYFPIYEAADHHGLPIVCHVTFQGVYLAGPVSPVPVQWMDYRANLGLPFRASLASVISNGVLERWRRLKFVWAEIGFAWVPDFIWHMDAMWRSTRSTHPWLERPPSEQLFEQCRFTSQPWIEPIRHDHIAQILDMVKAEQTLLFSSDYPHWDFDDPLIVERQVPEAIRGRVLAENALEVFGDRLL